MVIVGVKAGSDGVSITGVLAVSPVVESVAVAVSEDMKDEGSASKAPVKLPSLETSAAEEPYVAPVRLSARVTLTMSPAAKPAPERSTTPPGE